MNANLILRALESRRSPNDRALDAALCDADVDDFLRDRTTHERRESQTVVRPDRFCCEYPPYILASNDFSAPG